LIPAARALGRLMRHSHRWLAASVAIAVGQAALLIPIGLLLQDAFDDEIPAGDIDGLIVDGVILLGLTLASSALALWTRWLVLTATKAEIARLRVGLLERLHALPATWFHPRESDRLHAIIVQDSERVDVMANALAGQVVPAALVSFALGIAMAIINPLLCALLAVTWPLMLLVSRRLRPRVRHRTRVWQEAFDRFSARTHFALRARPLISAHAAEDVELAAGGAEARELSAAGLSMAWLQSFYGHLNGALVAISAVLVLIVGGAAVAEGTTSLGSLIAFYALLGLLRGQLAMLLSGIPQVISGGESLERLEEILNAADPPAYTGTRSLQFTGAVALRDVTFAYRDEPVLRALNLEAAPGEWVAITGPNGAGKSTVAAIVLGIYRPQHGAVLADGIDLAELDVSALRPQMGLVPQDPILFGGTIAENIAYGADRVDADAVGEAARLAGLAPMLESLPEGLETVVGDDGELLSGGQRQAVAAARALLRRPSLLILDEPTTSLDRETAPSLLGALRQLPWRPAVLLVSHDPAAVAHADRVYALDHGSATQIKASPVRQGRAGVAV
jgi:ABC-type multidrug transport system fused ATPase/permease subunit